MHKGGAWIGVLMALVAGAPAAVMFWFGFASLTTHRPHGVSKPGFVRVQGQKVTFEARYVGARRGDLEWPDERALQEVLATYCGVEGCETR